MIKLLVDTNQDALSMSYIALMKQGMRSGKHDSCLYYGGEGIACAIGHLIAEGDRRGLDEDDTAILSPSIGALVRKSRVDIGRVSSKLLRAMQWAHDENMEVTAGKFREQLTEDYQRLADEFNLTLPEIVK